MRLQTVYGNIIFPDHETAIVQSIARWETITGKTIEDCEELAEHNAGYYGGDWLIPELFAGRITWEARP